MNNLFKKPHKYEKLEDEDSIYIDYNDQLNHCIEQGAKLQPTRKKKNKFLIKSSISSDLSNLENNSNKCLIM